MDCTSAKILAQMQETKPTRIKKRSCQKVSSIFCFAVGFHHGYGRCVPGENLPTYILYSLVCRVKALNAIPYYRDKVYDPDLTAATRKQNLKGLRVTV